MSLDPQLPRALARLYEWRAGERGSGAAALDPELGGGLGPGTAGVPLLARYGGCLSSGGPFLRGPARPDGATKRGRSGGLAALAFWRLGRRHPNSISPESVAGLRPRSFANAMFV